MTFGLLNTLMLVGLVAVIIPPIIHLLNRRRFDVVDWGAMQFLQTSQTTRRRLRIEDLLLMLLRMGLIALLVLALAAPFAAHPVFATLGNRSNRDVVLIFDGSYSMGYTGSGQTPHEAAKDWATAFVKDLSAGDRVAVLQAKQQVTPVVGDLTHDLEQVGEAIAHLSAPRGGCSWPEAIQAAHHILRPSKRPERDIIVLSDGQRFGWADEATLMRWELLATSLRNQGPRPAIWVVNVDPHRPVDPPNWSLAPLRASRSVASAGQQITFRTALQLRGQQEHQPPYRMYLEVDGRHVRDLKLPTTAPLDRGQVPLSFRHHFPAAGSHLVSVVIEPDPPLAKRPPGYRVKDQLPGDNRCDLALEVVETLPVLLVDGDLRPNPKHRGTDFLRDALSPARDRTPVVKARVATLHEFTPPLLGQNAGPARDPTPRVLVLANVPRLTAEQEKGVAQFLTNGGGLLVTLGERVDAPYYNDQLYRGGRGWLPAVLEKMAGEETDAERAVHPLPSSLFHPAVELFHEMASGGLADARFPRWWRLTTPERSSAAVPVALFSNQDLLLVERSYFAGRVLLCAVPLDNSWRTNFPNLPEFAPLAHELVYYLAGARAAEHNLHAGQPLIYRAPGAERSSPLTLQPPTGESRQVQVAQWPLVYEDTRETGVYRLATMNNRIVHYVVQPDHRESDLTPCEQADRDKVARLIPMTYENDLGKKETVLASTDQMHELWKWLLLGVLGLLLGEVWMTRRLAKGRSL
jgi:hypothetical protein